MASSKTGAFNNINATNHKGISGPSFYGMFAHTAREVMTGVLIQW